MVDNGKKPSPEILRQAILQSDEPILFRGFLNNDEPDGNWRLFELNNLSKLISGTYTRKLPFRIGVNARTPEPQWDIACPVITMDMVEFINRVQNNDSKQWYYFDYKYMNDWFKEKPDILNAINWRNFGFDKSGEESTLWIGSKGAHTNCHQDTYGCNLIAQLHGSKQWLLFPPESGTMLKQTRVPYEESTIYSKINFFCPSKEDEEYVMKSDFGYQLPKLTTLGPGDVLLVPRGWWHYVESLDVTVSVNVWLPLEVDHETRIKEALVKLIMSGLGKGVPAADQPPSTVQTCLELVEACRKQYCDIQGSTDRHCSNKKMEKTPCGSQDLEAKYPEHIIRLDALSGDSLREFLISKRDRFPKVEVHLQKEHIATHETTSSYHTLELLIDNLCHTDNINNLLKLLLEKE